MKLRLAAPLIDGCNGVHRDLGPFNPMAPNITANGTSFGIYISQQKLKMGPLGEWGTGGSADIDVTGDLEKCIQR